MTWSVPWIIMVNKENKIGKGADETNLCKIYYANITENNVFIHTLVEHKISGNGPMIVHRRKSSVIGIRIESTNCKKNELTFNNLNFNLKYLMRFYHF